MMKNKFSDSLNSMYRKSFDQSRLTSGQVVESMIDLKKRIDGDFYVISQDETEIVLGNRKCPFGENVRGRPALCMMTSNVFGRITAENLGYACVEVEESFALGNDRCLVRIGLNPQESDKKKASGREYFRIDEDP